LSFPFDRLLIFCPSSVILLVSLGIVSTYTGYVLGQFKLKNLWVSNMGDAGEVVFGSWGREILGAAQVLFLVFVMASHLLTFVIAMNTITGHGTCSIVFGVVGMIISLILSLPRTLAKMSWLSLVCKMTSCLTPNLVANFHPSFYQHYFRGDHLYDRRNYKASGWKGHGNCRHGLGSWVLCRH
jgi:hypothetical protein